MSPAYDALYRTVLIAPDDDLPRLVLADWMQENGQEAKVKELRRAVVEKQAVQAPIRGVIDGIAVRRRGFVENVAIAPAEFMAKHKQLFGVHPITSVFFTVLEPLNLDGDTHFRRLDRYATRLSPLHRRFCRAFFTIQRPFRVEARKVRRPTEEVTWGLGVNRRRPNGDCPLRPGRRTCKLTAKGAAVDEKRYNWVGCPAQPPFEQGPNHHFSRKHFS